MALGCYSSLGISNSHRWLDSWSLNGQKKLTLPYATRLFKNLLHKFGDPAYSPPGTKAGPVQLQSFRPRRAKTESLQDIDTATESYNLSFNRWLNRKIFLRDTVCCPTGRQTSWTTCCIVYKHNPNPLAFGLCRVNQVLMRWTKQITRLLV